MKPMHLRGRPVAKKLPWSFIGDGNVGKPVIMLQGPAAMFDAMEKCDFFFMDKDYRDRGSEPEGVWFVRRKWTDVGVWDYETSFAYFCFVKHLCLANEAKCQNKIVRRAKDYAAMNAAIIPRTIKSA